MEGAQRDLSRGSQRHGRTMGENMKLIHDPLMGKDMEIKGVLIRLASQENMDGEPYDQLMEAARYIKQLEDRVVLLEVTVRELGGEL